MPQVVTKLDTMTQLKQMEIRSPSWAERDRKPRLGRRSTARMLMNNGTACAPIEAHALGLPCRERNTERYANRDRRAGR